MRRKLPPTFKAPEKITLGDWEKQVVGAFKERLKEKVAERMESHVQKRLIGPDGIFRRVEPKHTECQWFITLIDETN